MRMLVLFLLPDGVVVLVGVLMRMRMTVPRSIRVDVLVGMLVRVLVAVSGHPSILHLPRLPRRAAPENRSYGL